MKDINNLRDKFVGILVFKPQDPHLSILILWVSLYLFTALNDLLILSWLTCHCPVAVAAAFSSGKMVQFSENIKK